VNGSSVLNFYILGIKYSKKINTLVNGSLVLNFYVFLGKELSLGFWCILRPG
jgi:hypothetical protein